jgi:acyl-CoA synthetase
MGKVLTLHDPHSAREHYLSGAWRQDTMYSLLCKHAADRGGRFALRDPHQRLTWAQVLARVDRVAEDLYGAGLHRGDRVSVWLPNRVEAVIILLACSRNGYICNTSLHQNYTVQEVVDLTSSIECSALFAQVGYGADADRQNVFTAAAQVASMRAIYALTGPAEDPRPPAKCKGFPTGPASSAGLAPVADPDKVVYLAFTSGTTGKPKGVMHSDNTLLANGRAMVADWRHDEQTVLLSLSPLSHHIGTVALEQSLVCGCELVLTDGRAGIKTLDWIEQTQATYVMGVPTHAMDLLHAMQARGQPGLGRVSIFYMAGAPIPREVASRFLQLGITPQNIYGMTENGSHQYTLPSDDATTITATCGRACPGYEVKLWQPDNPDFEAQPGEVGEIGGRGGLLMLGYYGNQKSTESAFNAHGWFMSGDLGRLDAHGNLQIVGRKKDLIIRGGHNIYPTRIENLALRHPDVAKAAVFPVPDERLGEKVCLAIVAQSRTPSAEALLQHLNEVGLSKYDMPEYFVVLPEFPLTASGKILKRELVAWCATGRIQPQPVRWQAKEGRSDGH